MADGRPTENIFAKNHLRKKKLKHCFFQRYKKQFIYNFLRAPISSSDIGLAPVRSTFLRCFYVSLILVVPENKLSDSDVILRRTQSFEKDEK
jgi:hypothetical protein